jgi:hypothetical protein
MNLPEFESRKQLVRIMSSYSHQDQVVNIYDNYESKFLTPFQRKVLLKNLQNNSQPEYRRRIEIMLLADMGKSQTHICEMIGCSQEMARYWIGIAEAGMAHKWNQRPLGRPKIVNDEYIESAIAIDKEYIERQKRETGIKFSPDKKLEQMQTQLPCIVVEISFKLRSGNVLTYKKKTRGGKSKRRRTIKSKSM